MPIRYIEEEIAEALSASAELGAFVEGRIYPMQLPSETNLPAVVYQRIESSPNYTMQGYGSETVTLAIDCFAEDYGVMKEMSLIIRNIMSNIPLMTVVMKEADICGDDDVLAHVHTEYNIQQIGGYNNG